MSLFAAVVETLTTTTTTDQDKAAEPVDRSPAPSVLPEKSDENLQQVFKLGKAIHDKKAAPLIKERKRLEAEVKAEQAIIDEAEAFNIEEADAETSREELTEQLIKLETAARISRQILDKKRRELDKVVDQIEKIRLSDLKAKQHARLVAENTAKSRRDAIVDFIVDGMHDHRLNQRSAVRELAQAAHCEKVLANYCECAETAKLATDEICAIALPHDSRYLYWNILSRRTRNENPQLDPTNQSTNQTTNDDTEVTQ